MLLYQAVLCCLLATFTSGLLPTDNQNGTVGLERREYSVVEGNELEICVEAISGVFSTDSNVTITVTELGKLVGYMSATVCCKAFGVILSITDLCIKYFSQIMFHSVT